MAFFALLLSAGCGRPADGVLEADRYEHAFTADVSDLRAAFTLTNTGGRDLVIENVSSSCVCAVAALPETRLAPGDSTRLEVEMHAPPVGEQNAQVTVWTDSPATPRVDLRLSCSAAGNAPRLLAVEPAVVRISHADAGRAELHVRTIEPLEDMWLDAVPSDSDHDRRSREQGIARLLALGRAKRYQ